MTELWDILKYILPMIVVGIIVYIILNKVLKEETLRRKIEFKSKKQDLITPQKLQAYERLALYLERIRPTNLVRRIDIGNDIETYEYRLVNSIQEEFDHNLSQQIYIFPETWKIIFSTKNATQNFIKQCRETLPEGANVEAFRAEIIRRSLEGNVPSNSTLLRLQADIQGDLQ